MATDSEFGFTIKKDFDKVDHWSVYLPHMCDEWMIAGDAGRGSVPHEQAVEQAYQFATEALAAYLMLNARRELPERA